MRHAVLHEPKMRPDRTAVPACEKHYQSRHSQLHREGLARKRLDPAELVTRDECFIQTTPVVQSRRRVGDDFDVDLVERLSTVVAVVFRNFRLRRPVSIDYKV